MLTAAQRPEQVTESRWHQPLSEPTRNFAARRAAHIAIIVAASGLFAPVLATAQFPEQVTESRWHQPLSEPVRVKTRLNEALQSTTTIDPWILTQPESVRVQWHAAFSEPVRSRPCLTAALQLAYGARRYGPNVKVYHLMDLLDRAYSDIGESARE